MDTREIKLRFEHQAVVDRFIKACEEDQRIVAAFLGGSYASGAADQFSDLDLYLITTNADFEDFRANRFDFVRRLGEPLFLDDFGAPDMAFYIMSDGVEGELSVGRESQFETMHSGPFITLLDRRGILTGAVFNGQPPDATEQTEKLHNLLYQFWHEVQHFKSAVGRGQLWWAEGELELMRGFCVSLARMSINFLDPEAGQEPYFKIERDIPVERLSALADTVGPLEKEHLLKAGLRTVQVFHALGLPLAQEHGIPYPAALEQVMVKKLESLK